MADDRLPWFKFFGSDWLGDPRLRACSDATRGLWMDLICIMDQSEQRGFLKINGNRPTDEELSRACGTTPEAIKTALAEMERHGVFSRNKAGVIYSRKMVRKENRARIGRENVKMRGDIKARNKRANPNYIKQKGMPRGQRPESRKKDTVEANAPTGDPAPAEPPMKDQLFGPCLKWLMERTGRKRGTVAGRIGKWIRDYGEGPTLEAFIAAQRASPVEAIAWIEKVLQDRQPPDVTAMEAEFDAQMHAALVEADRQAAAKEGKPNGDQPRSQRDRNLPARASDGTPDSENPEDWAEPEIPRLH